MGHVYSLDEEPLHFVVVYFSPLDANPKVKPNQFAISLGKPGWHVGVLIRDVQSCGETVARQ